MTADFIPYLSFDGQCEAAFAFYARALGGEVVAMIRYGDAPFPSPPEAKARIMHAELKVDGRSLMGGDAPRADPAKPQGFCVALQIGDPAAAERAFAALGEGGRVTMPFGPTFFSLGFGMLTDKFGAPWMINCPKAQA